MDPELKQPNTPFYAEVSKATTCAIEATPLSIIRDPSQDSAPIDHVPIQDSAQRSRTRRSMSAQPVSLVNWDIFEKQRPDGRVDKYYRHKELRFVCRSKLEVSRYEISGVRPQRPKKTKFNKEQTEALEPLLALPWKDKADDNEVQECSNESLKTIHNSNPSTSTMPSTSAVLKGKSEGKKKTEKMKRSSHESDIDMDDIVAFSQLVDVPKTIIDRFDDE